MDHKIDDSQWSAKKQKRACIYNEHESHVGMDFAPFRFFFAEKSVIMLRHSSFIAKGHIRVGYSVASALITPLAHYQLLRVCLRQEYLYGSAFSEKAVKIDAICFDRILMRFLSIFEKFDLTKKQ